MKINSITLFNPKQKSENNYKNIKYNTQDIPQDIFEKSTQTQTITNPQSVSFGISKSRMLANCKELLNYMATENAKQVTIEAKKVWALKALGLGKNSPLFKLPLEELETIVNLVRKEYPFKKACDYANVATSLPQSFDYITSLRKPDGSLRFRSADEYSGEDSKNILNLIKAHNDNPMVIEKLLNLFPDDSSLHIFCRFERLVNYSTEYSPDKILEFFGKIDGKVRKNISFLSDMKRYDQIAKNYQSEAMKLINMRNSIAGEPYLILSYVKSDNKKLFEKIVCQVSDKDCGKYKYSLEEIKEIMGQENPEEFYNYIENFDLDSIRNKDGVFENVIFQLACITRRNYVRFHEILEIAPDISVANLVKTADYALNKSKPYRKHETIISLAKLTDEKTGKKRFGFDVSLADAYDQSPDNVKYVLDRKIVGKNGKESYIFDFYYKMFQNDERTDTRTLIDSLYSLFIHHSDEELVKIGKFIETHRDKYNIAELSKLADPYLEDSAAIKRFMTKIDAAHPFIKSDLVEIAKYYAKYEGVIDDYMHNNKDIKLLLKSIEGFESEQSKK